MNCTGRGAGMEVHGGFFLCRSIPRQEFEIRLFHFTGEYQDVFIAILGVNTLGDGYRGISDAGVELEILRLQIRVCNRFGTDLAD